MSCLRTPGVSHAEAGNVRLVIPVVVAAVIFGLVLMFSSSPDEGGLSDNDDVASVDDSVTGISEEDRQDTNEEVTDSAATAETTTESTVGVTEDGDREIQGIVRNALTLDPIEGAKVELRSMQGWQGVGEETLAKAVTAADGSYSLRSTHKKTGQRVLLLTNSDGFVGVNANHWGGIQKDDLGTTYLTPGVKVTGTVRGPNGPVSGGEVWSVANLSVQNARNWGQARGGAVYAFGAAQGPAKIDSNGRFTIYTNGDLVAVQAHVPGFAPAFSEAFTLRVDGNNDVEISVIEGKVFEGIVRNGAGDPVAGAKVRVNPMVREVAPDSGFQRYVTGGTGETDQSGRFRIADMPDQVSQLVVSHDDYMDYNEWNFRGSTGSDPVEIELKGGQWVVGVAKFEDGSFVPAGRASMQVQNNQWGGWQMNQVTITEEGRFKTTVIDETTASFTMTPTGALSKEIKFEPAPGERDVGEQIFELGKTLTVTVTNEEGSPIENAYVSAIPKQYAAQPWMANQLNAGGERTDGSGQATLRGLNIGEYKLSSTHDGYSVSSANIHFKKDDAALSHELVMYSAARVLLTVQDEAGQPLSGVSAFLTRAGGSVQRNWWNPTSANQSGPDGRLAVPNVEIGVSHTLTLSRPGLTDFTEAVDALEAGESRDLGALTMETGATLRGRVMSSVGGALPNAVVSVNRSQNFRGNWGGGRNNRSAGTDEAGNFTVTGLEDGTWSVRCACEGYVSSNQTVTITEGQSDLVVFKLEPGKPFEGVVVYEDDTPATGVYMNIWGGGGGGNYNTQTDAEGKFRFESTPNGAVTLNISLWGQGAGKRNYNESFQGDSIDELPTRIVIPDAAQLILNLSVNGKRELPKAVNVMLTAAENTNGRMWWGNQGPAVPVDEEGKAVKEGLQEGSFNLVVTAKDFPDTEKQLVDLVAGETTEVNVILDGTASSVTIVVKDQEGNPVPRANVSISGSASNNGMNMVVFEGGGMSMGGNLVTDAEGKCVTYDLIGDDKTVTARANGYAPFSLKDAVSQVSAGELLITLEAESAFLVTVLDSNGDPLDGVYVSCSKLNEDGDKSSGTPSPRRVRRMGGGAVMGGSGGGQTSGGGVVRIGGLTAGAFKLTASYMGETIDELEAVLGVSEEKSLEMRRPDGITVRGQARLNGEPIASGSIQFTTKGTNKTATVDSDGGFEIELVNTGTYRVYYGQGNNRLDGGEHEISDSTTLSLEFTSVTLSGMVMDPDGEPVANVRGFLRGAQGTSGWYNFQTDAEGNYEVAAISPGTYTMTASPNNSEYYAPPVEVVCNEDTVANYQFESARQITIVVVGDNVPGQVWVQAVLGEGKSTWVQTKGTPSEGLTVSWPMGVSRGYVSGSNLARTVFDIAEDQDTVEVAVQEGGQLVVTVMDAGERVSDHSVRIEAVDGEELDEDLALLKSGNNGSAWTRLAPGTYKVSTTLPSGEKVEETAIIKATASSNVTLGTDE